MDCSPPGSSVHGIFQARVLEWGAIAFSNIYMHASHFLKVSLVAQMVKNLPSEWEPLEKAMATHSSTLAWKSPWMEEPGRLQSMGSLRVGYD